MFVNTENWHLQSGSRNLHPKDLWVTVASFPTRVSRIILEHGKRKLSSREAPSTGGGSGSWALLFTLRGNGGLSWGLIQCQCSGRGPREYKSLCARPVHRAMGWECTTAWGARFFRGKRLVFMSTFLSVRGEELSIYLLTNLLSPEQSWNLHFALRFLSCAFHCQPVWKPHVPPGTSQTKLMQTLSSQVPHDHLSSNASQEATAPADTEAWLGSSPLYLLLKILLLPFLSCRIEVPRESVGTAESRGRADQVGTTAALLCRDGAGPEHAEVGFAWAGPWRARGEAGRWHGWEEKPGIRRSMACVGKILRAGWAWHTVRFHRVVVSPQLQPGHTPGPLGVPSQRLWGHQLVPRMAWWRGRGGAAGGRISREDHHSSDHRSAAPQGFHHPLQCRSLAPMNL